MHRKHVVLGNPEDLQKPVIVDVQPAGKPTG
jgi:hypothetical protein